MTTILKCELCETSTDNPDRMEQDAELVVVETGEATTGTRCRDRAQCDGTNRYLLHLGWSGKTKDPNR